MGTIAENVFGRKLGRTVKAGEMVTVSIDSCMLHDINGPASIDNFNAISEKVCSPSKHMLVIDHLSPCPNVKAANAHQKMRRFAALNKIELAEEGQGVCHQLMIEKGRVLPGSITVGTDSHSCTYGALNAFGVSVGAADAAIILACDKCWFKVPKSIKVVFSKKPANGITSKDLALAMIKELGEEGAVYKCIEFSGEALSYISIEGRMGICNFASECGAKSAVMPYDDMLQKWLAAREIKNYTPVSADEGAVYEKTVVIDTSALKPMAAVGPSIDNIAEIDTIGDVQVDQVVIGSCAGGRFEDFKQAADILKGKSVAKGVRLLLVPASATILKEMVSSGVYSVLLEAGAVVLTPGCGPCAGVLGGLLGDGETVVSTTNRNLSGRMGSSKANIYLVSSETAAWSALYGKIFNGEGGVL